MNSQSDTLRKSNLGWLPTRSTTTIPATEYVHDYVLAGAILFPIVIFLLVANVLMFSAVLDMILSRRRGESCCGPVLVLNLAVADSLLGIASLIALSDAVEPNRSLTGCYVTVGIIAMSTMASCMIMAAIAFERYKLIRKPFRNRKNETAKVIAVAFMIWISSALVGFAPFMGWRAEDPYNEQGRCLFLTAVPDSYILFVFFGMYLPTLSVTAYLHIVMCQASRRQSKKIAACEILPDCARRQRNAGEVAIGRSRLRTEMTDVPSPDITRINNHSEHIFTVAGNMAAELNLPARPATAYGPIETTVTEHHISAIDETTPTECHDAAPSNNMPSIWNTLRPEKWSRTVILILGFFICMWSPFWIVCVMQAICVNDMCNYEDLASTYLFVIGVSNSAVNPVVYISTDKKLKEHFCQCFFRSTAERSNEHSSSVFMSSEVSEEA